MILKAKMEAGMEVNEKYRKTKKKEAMVVGSIKKEGKLAENE